VSEKGNKNGALLLIIWLGNMATKDKWLFVLVRANDEEDEETDASPTGIHVLNQSDLVQASLFLGNIMGMKCLNDNAN
jgi:hypothetical protein